MNFITLIREGDVAVELKYCERCGGLWLRAAGHDGIHCKKCAIHVAELLAGRGITVAQRRKRPRPAQVEWLLGVAEMEVRA